MTCVGLCLTAQLTKAANRHGNLLCTQRGAKILAKDTVHMFNSGGDRPQSIHAAWHVRGLDSVSYWSVLPRMQLLRLGRRECLGPVTEPGAGGGGLLVSLQAWEMEESCDSEGWKLEALPPGGSLLLCQQIGNYRTGSVPKQQAGA